MAKFEYFATLGESLALLRELFDQRYDIVHDREYDKPAAPRHSTLDTALSSALLANPGYFLAGAFTRSPIRFSDLDHGAPGGKYRVNDMDQGPVMNCILPRLNVVDGLPTLLSGDISIQSRGYYNPETNVWEPPSEELKAAYKKAVSIIKKHARPYRSGKTIYIMPEARRLLERGEARINDPKFINPAPTLH